MGRLTKSAWGDLNPCDSNYIFAWQEFLNSSYAKNTLDFDYRPVDTTSFSEEQSLAYNIILNHSCGKSPEPLLLIVTGEAGTGKSYLINAVRNYLKKRCVVTATTGKAAFNINGVTIHSLLKLPILATSQKDLFGQSLVVLQESLVGIEYIIIDEYSMLGQNTMGWIDCRCRQATGVQQEIFGGKSIILIGDAGQLLPVGDKPLFHSKPANDVGQQGFIAYSMFSKVIQLTKNQRVASMESDQESFRSLLARLRNGQSTLADWKKLLDRQPSKVKNLNHFNTATRLFYNNKDVAKYNYEQLTKLNNPIAMINARHSTAKAQHISPQQVFGLHPCIFLCKGAKVMLTMNLWPSAGLCNGSTGTVIDIIYAPDHSPPDLPIAVIVKFDNYIGPSFFNRESYVPISPITASVYIDNSIHERQQLLLTLAWALTIHKSQGMTLDHAWVDIGKKELTVGMTYVAISRVRNLSSLIIEPITFDRLTSIKELETLKYRVKEEKRLKEIAIKTRLLTL